MANNKKNNRQVVKRRPRRLNQLIAGTNTALARTGILKQLPVLKPPTITSVRVILDIQFWQNSTSAPYIYNAYSSSVFGAVYLSGKYKPWEKSASATYILNPRSLAVSACAKVYGIDMYDSEVQKLRLYKDMQYSITSCAISVSSDIDCADIGLLSNSVSYDSGSYALGRTAVASVQPEVTGIPYGKVSILEATWNKLDSVESKDLIVCRSRFAKAVEKTENLHKEKIVTSLGHLTVSVNLSLNPYETVDRSATSVNRVQDGGTADASMKTMLAKMSKL